MNHAININFYSIKVYNPSDAIDEALEWEERDTKGRISRI